MRRAGHERTASAHTTSTTPRGNSLRASLVAPREFGNGSTSAVASAETEVLLSTDGTFVTGGAIDSDNRANRRRQLAIAIRQRIESRLPGRVRNLVVRIFGDSVVLEGQCATYYTKQLAQHAALGILEDEHLENSIVVSVAR